MQTATKQREGVRTVDTIDNNALALLSLARSAQITDIKPFDPTIPSTYALPTSPHDERIVYSKVEKVIGKKQQLRINGHYFNRKEVQKKCIVYRCKYYRSQNCPVLIRYYEEENQYTECNEHTHPDTVHNKKTTLSEERKAQIRDWLRNNPDEFRLDVIQTAVNASLALEQKQDPFLYATRDQITKIKRENYTERVTGFEHLYLREELSKTLDHNQFLQFEHLFPIFMIMYMGNYAGNYVDRIDISEQQFYIDGTFNAAPQGVEQVVTLSVRKLGTDSVIPLVHTFLQEKTTLVYMHMWNHMLKLLPKLRSAKQLVISLDFESAMHEAIAKVLPQAKRLGCYFHLKKNVRKQMKTKGSKWLRGKVPADRQREKLWWENIQQLAKNDSINFEQLRDVFISYWGSREHELLAYFCSIYLDDDARFPPPMWARSCMKDLSLDVDQTDNCAEVFHRDMNALFKRRPTLKKSVRILQIMEHKTRSNQIFDAISTLRALEEEDALIDTIDREITNTRKRKRPVKELQIVNPKQQERAAERAAKRRREQLQSEDIGVRIEEPSEHIEVQAIPSQSSTQSTNILEHLYQQYELGLQKLGIKLQEVLKRFPNANVQQQQVIKHEYQKAVQKWKDMYNTAVQAEMMRSANEIPSNLLTCEQIPSILSDETPLPIVTAQWTSSQQWTWVSGTEQGNKL
jgi:hypothetical protein